MTAVAPVLDRPLHRSRQAAAARRRITAVEVSSPPVAVRAQSPAISYRIHRIRAAIARGAYDDPELLDIALDRMIDAVLSHRRKHCPLI